MDKLKIYGGNNLKGEVKIQGAKNSALPILCAALLCSERIVLHNCPVLSDVESTIEILEYFGCEVSREGGTVIITPCENCLAEIPQSMMCKMRSSIIFMGAMLSKNGQARLCYPGGCELGPRPIDIHLNSFRRLGISVGEEKGFIDCKCRSERTKGTAINLPFPSVGATENIILASIFCEGTTKIYNAAREPEIVDLAVFLNKCGADIKGAGGTLITISGVKKLKGCEHSIIPDRIAASTYMCFCAVTGGEVMLSGVTPEHIEPVIFAFREAGCELFIKQDSIRIKAPPRLSSIKEAKSLVYPGFPTDSGMPLIAMCTLARGTSIYIETIFRDRYKAAAELAKMGAKIKIVDSAAIIEGVPKLYGAEVKSTDLRGSAALVVAALAAEGKSIVTDTAHINRGYEDIAENLARLGADITAF